MTNKLILVGLAIAAVGLIALPQTFALFAGQHNWYDVLNGDPAANYGIPCKKCHSDVYAELELSRNLSGLTGVHRTTECASCHITVFVAAKGMTVGGNADIHAAALPRCLDCHSGYAGPNALGILNANSSEAHVPFASQANSSLLLKGENEACVACHTHVAVDINWQKAYKIGFTAIETADTGVHSWSVGNFIAEGKVTVSTYGNSEGNNTGMTNPVVDISMISPPPPNFDPANP